MWLALFFSITLLISCLASDLAGRSLLSLAVLSLLAGFLLGALGLLSPYKEDPVMLALADVALVSVLYTDAAKINPHDLIRTWRLPGRALFFGMPLTLAATALVARITTGISWGEAFLVGAVLSPTDPVFAASLINSPKIPEKVRFLLNVESGVNDGLALPVVLLLIGMLGTKEPDMGIIGWELVEGLLLGTAVPWLALSIENRVGFLGAHRRYLSLLGFALIALVFCAARLLHANEFFASFAAGLTVASFRRNALDTILSFSEQLGELLKLGALMLFGASLVRQFGAFTFGEILFVALAVLLVRPAAIWLTLLHSGFTKRERLVIGFFGPKGFASVVFGLLVLNMGVPNSAYLFRLIALTVASSIILLSTVDILAPGWLVDEAGRRPTGGSRGTPRRKPSA